MINPETWMEIREGGFYCVPAECYVDPMVPVTRAVVTHGHADHASRGHGRVWATPETIDIMRTRNYVADETQTTGLPYGQRHDLGGGVTLWFASAGHILGSAQAVFEYQGQRIVAAGDFKRHPDPTCAPFEVVPCDVFITEATFALPVFQHPPLEDEVEKLMRSMRTLPDRTHIVGVYALGKCQRVMKTLRLAGYEHPFYIHGALKRLTELYESYGQDFGVWQLVSEIDRNDKDRFRGKIVLCPPAQINDRWSRRFADPLPTVASGWMQIRARARQKRAELGLVVSDHADWNDLLRTCRETGAGMVWITHGRVEALEYALKKEGINAKGLHLIGIEEAAGE
ncbi:DNA ligase-associated DEXH box helicase [Algimonas arctica]|uniref:DNA ligase-associated DEXH box helicase n=1 Tax=Algimonas arctica TaxID=1479486 RepID=A0A8J3CQX4_9PROT|nr:ligase-associated DNA damage response exonuclease [Algimonas arctica]GHA86024.1 DNA ligase-associated DEXH box helicase [Algimonas arctica]